MADGLADLIELLEINQDANDDGEKPVEEPGYRQIIEELRVADFNAVLRLLDNFTTGSRLELGMYGAISVGTKGARYNRVRQFLTEEAHLNDLPILRQYISGPVNALPVYQGAGPGGQGESTKRLNSCVANVRDRIQRVLGMLLVLQNNGNDDVNVQGH